MLPGEEILKTSSNITFFTLYKAYMKTDLFPMLSIKELLNLYTSSTKMHEPMRELIIEQLIKLLLKSDDTSLRKHEKIFRCHSLTNNATMIAKKEEIILHISQIMKTQYTSLQYKTLAVGFLARLTGKKLEIDDKSFDFWLDEIMMNEPKTNQNLKHLKHLKHTRQLIIEFLTAAQIARYYQDALEKLNQCEHHHQDANINQNTLFDRRLRALECVLPFVSLNKEEEIELVTCLIKFQEKYYGSGYSYDTLLFVLTASQDCLSDPALKAKICQASIQHQIVWDPDNHLIDEDPEHNLLKYFIRQIYDCHCFVGSIIKIQSITSNWRFIVSFMSEKCLEKTWEQIVNKIHDVHKKMRTPWEEEPDKRHESLIRVFSVLAERMNKEIINNALFRFLHDFIEIKRNDFLLSYIPFFCEHLKTHLLQNETKLRQVFDTLFFSFKNRILNNDFYVRFLYKALIAILGCLAPGTTQAYDLFSFVRQDESRLDDDSILPFLNQDQRFFAFHKLVRLSQKSGHYKNAICTLAQHFSLEIETLSEEQRSTITDSFFCARISSSIDNSLDKEMLTAFPVLMRFITDKNIDLLKIRFSELTNFFIKLKDYRYTECDHELITLLKILQSDNNALIVDKQLISALFNIASLNEHAANILCQLVFQGDENVQAYIRENLAKQETLWCIILDRIIQGHNIISQINHETEQTLLSSNSGETAEAAEKNIKPSG